MTAIMLFESVAALSPLRHTVVFLFCRRKRPECCDEAGTFTRERILEKTC